MEKYRAPALEAALTAACILGAAAVFLLPIANPDLWWHLSAARRLFETGSFPAADWLSHTRAGAPWANFEWGVQAIWSFLHKIGGVGLLWALKAVLLGGTGIFVWQAASGHGAVAVFLWALASTAGNDLRPENFSLLFFAALFLALEKGKRSLWIPLLFAVWANLHAGFLFGLVLLSIYAAGDFVRRRETVLLKILVFSVAAACLNPFGAKVYSVGWSHAAELGILRQHIKEWGPASIWAPSLIPFWFVFIAAFASIRRQNAERVAALIFFGLSAVWQVRTAVYFTIIAAPIAAAVYSGRRLVILGGILFFFIELFPSYAGFTPFREMYVPKRAADFLRSEREVLGGKKLFNPWHWGGYLGYTLSPDFPVFMDGRYLFHSLLPETDKARDTPELYGEFLKRYGVEIAVVSQSGQRLPMTVELRGGGRKNLLRPLDYYFHPRESWALIHWDALSLVFVKRTAVPPEWLEKNEFRWFRPGDLEAAVLLGAKEEISREAARFAATAEPAQKAAAEGWLKAFLEGRQ